MHDPLEGVSDSGTITTGADLDRVPPTFVPVLATAATAVGEHDDRASLYVFGSVATGQARVGHSDVDLLTIGVPREHTVEIAAQLSGQFRAICRGVEIAAATPGDFPGDHDEAYGNRVFLRHYCVHDAGDDRASSTAEFRADRRAARGFNGDIAAHARRWRAALDLGEDPSAVGRRMARKTLLAVAGLVSVHDHTWTTDREHGAERWAEVCPEMSTGLATLLTWTAGSPPSHMPAIADVLTGTIGPIVSQFAELIGLWPDGSRVQ